MSEEAVERSPAVALASTGLATAEVAMPSAATVSARIRDGLAPSWAPPLRVALLTLHDLFVIAVVALAAIRLWAVGVRGQTLGDYLHLAPLMLLFVIGFAKAGLYPGFGMGAIETLRRLSLRSSFVFLVLAAGSFVLKVPPTYSRVTFFLAWGGILVALPVGRQLLLALVHDRRWWGEPAVVVGTGPQARRLVGDLRGALTLGYRPRWVLRLPGGAPPPSDLVHLGGLEQVEPLARHGVRVALVLEEKLSDRGGALDLLQAHFRHVILVRSNAGDPIEGVVVRNMGGSLGIEYCNQLLRRRHRLVKRTMDLVAGSVCLLLALPLIGLGIVLVKLVSRGPAFFAQEREGLGGRRIRVRKLRTMYVDADRRLRRHLEEHPEARREWESRFKLTHDPRILPVVGRFLRRFSLDELPQLWSVVTGEMSLVGPRPFPDYHLESLPARFRDLRRRVRPGLTGLWQVMVRSHGDVEDQERFDSYYIRNWSIWMDLYILGRTVMAVLAGRGAY
ncbi:MAG: exopolysaccharide biosynthesis polyprenyl glycosylphosphotransferase [Thermoanaerobaculia bacterium]|nr:exopolysaccharide biosynthesis polyprenyl glycosylphosphotransferase [Thermoanaerobaculia bacterium]